MDFYKELRNPNNFMKWVPEMKKQYSVEEIVDILFPLYDLGDLLMFFDYEKWLGKTPYILFNLGK